MALVIIVLIEINERIKAKKKPLTVWSNEDLGLDMNRIGLQGSPTQPGELITPHMERSSEVLGTDPEEAADKIIALMKTLMI